MAKKGSLRKSNYKEYEERPVRIRRYKYLFLIVCEDENTEPAYFEQFQVQIPVETMFLRSVGTGRDPLGVVHAAIKEKESLSIKFRKEVDEVWVVFDKDDADENKTKVDRFELAFEIAKTEKFEIAYSNEVFELWLLLHLMLVDYSSPLPRSTIYQLLQTSIRNNKDFADFNYKHGNANILDIIKKIGNEPLAIERAKLLMEKQSNKRPIEANPSTKIHLLITQIHEWIAYYSY